MASGVSSYSHEQLPRANGARRLPYGILPDVYLQPRYIIPRMLLTLEPSPLHRSSPHTRGTPIVLLGFATIDIRPPHRLPRMWCGGLAPPFSLPHKRYLYSNRSPSAQPSSTPPTSPRLLPTHHTYPTPRHPLERAVRPIRMSTGMV